MKEVNTEEEINAITGETPTLIELGTPETCMPCKMLADNLHLFESENRYNIEYAQCSNVDTIFSMGYRSLPVLIMITDKVKDVLTDSSILIDEEELSGWIENRL